MSGRTAVRLGERYAREQIVVDIEHRQVVKALLAEIPFRVEDGGSLPELGLALLSVPDLRAEPLRRKMDYEAVVRKLRKDRSDLELPGDPSDLDVLMQYLRHQAARQHAGWIPVMGKNRDVEAIGGLPHVGGGEGLPTPLPKDPVAVLPPPDPRRRAVRIAVLDTGLFPNEALERRVTTADFIEVEDPLRPWHGHAAFVIGRILQRAPGAEVHLRRVLRDDNGRASSWDVAQGMASFLGSGMDILNMSLGFSTADGAPGLVMERAVTALAAEMVLVAAAGNHGNQPEELDDPTPLDDLATVPRKGNSPMWPAALSNVVAVGATDAAFSPRDVPWLDLVAPGADVESTFLTGEVRAHDAEIDEKQFHRGTVALGQLRTVGVFQGTARWSGTSFAAAAATGEIAELAAQTGQTARQALRTIRARRPGGKHDVHRPPRPAAARAAEPAPRPAVAAAS